ncbi:MAG: metallophosphoesterase [Acidiferrobacterales bacterium]|nr:metallophosphoesterase [Acidiferrobacterales bacterium]
MKILIYSDLHLEFSNCDVPRSGYDVVVLAGDIHLGSQGASWAKSNFTEVPVIYLCGNHEYYRGEVAAVHHAIRQETKGSNIHFCENRSVEVGNVRFLCATLWTDLRSTGDELQLKALGSHMMNDYRLIKFGDRVLDPDDTQRFHFESRRYLESELNDSSRAAMKTVVVTHHAPSLKSLRYERVDPEFSSFYASSLDDLIMQSQASLWIHGHTHESVDYQIGTTRVVSNPRGYSTIPNEHGNPNFRAECIISVQ